MGETYWRLKCKPHLEECQFWLKMLFYLQDKEKCQAVAQSFKELVKAMENRKVCCITIVGDQNFSPYAWYYFEDELEVNTSKNKPDVYVTKADNIAIVNNICKGKKPKSLSDEEVEKARRMYEDGIRISEITKHFNCYERTVRRAIKGEGAYANNSGN